MNKMMRVISECDICKKVIEDDEIYLAIQFRLKGIIGIRKDSRCLCNNCVQKSEILKKLESFQPNRENIMNHKAIEEKFRNR